MNTRFGAPNTDSGILRNRSTSSETAVHLPPETLFDFNRNPCSASPKYAVWCQKDRAAAWSQYQKLAREAFSRPTLSPLVAPQLTGQAEYQVGNSRLLSSWNSYLRAHDYTERPACDSPVARNLAFVKKSKISGVPAVIFEDGTLIAGLTPAARIEAQLVQSHARVTASE
ncbi:MAG: thioredoxin fold domain-containing protein [Paraburkholderia sp.]|jgi:thiol:disulfide interchange protein DsbC|nr:thioredoxin fold domain-containing protein [Paraburkholderia sp.]